MRLICEICAERRLSAVINIHDVALAQMFVQRVIGLRAGKVVYDGLPGGLTPEVLTSIYGEEDWNVSREDEGDEGPLALPLPPPDRNRLASV